MSGSSTGARRRAASRPVLLMGFMGAGKSTVGPLLGRRLGFSFVDLDTAVSEHFQSPANEQLAAMGEREFRRREGVVLEDGPTAPAKVAVVAPGLLRIVIHEGRNRQVRRMCDAIGHPVRRLVRTRIGPVSDTALAPGTWRRLSIDEVRALSAAAAPRPDSPRPRLPPEADE